MLTFFLSQDRYSSAIRSSLNFPLIVMPKAWMKLDMAEGIMCYFLLWVEWLYKWEQHTFKIFGPSSIENNFYVQCSNQIRSRLNCWTLGAHWSKPFKLSKCVVCGWDCGWIFTRDQFVFLFLVLVKLPSSNQIHDDRFFRLSKVVHNTWTIAE